MIHTIESSFNRLVDWANANDGATQTLFSLVLVLVAVLAWWVSRQSAFNSVLPVPAFDIKKKTDEYRQSFRIIVLRNVGLGPAIDVNIMWQPGPDVGTFELPKKQFVVAIEAGGSEDLGQRTLGLASVKDKSGEPPWREERFIGTWRVTYKDAHGRQGKLIARLMLIVSETSESSSTSLDVEVLLSRLPEDRSRRFFHGRWLTDRS